MWIKKNLTYFLQKYNYSCRKLENEINISRVMTSRIINGKKDEKNLYLKTVIKLANYFEVSLQDFVFADLSQIDKHKAIFQNTKIHLKANLNYLLENDGNPACKIELSSGLSNGMIHNIVHGKAKEENLAIETVVKLANYFNVTLDEFVFKDLSLEESTMKGAKNGKP